MAAESRTKIVGQITGGPGGPVDINTAEFVNSVSPVYEETFVLANGDNIVLVAPGSKGVIIFFDAASVTNKKLKGVGGDTGLAIRKNGYHYIQFEDTPPASIIVNSSALDGVLLTRFKFI